MGKLGRDPGMGELRGAADLATFGHFLRQSFQNHTDSACPGKVSSGSERLRPYRFRTLSPVGSAQA
jgi:hypothetical protein